jgi:hypothetical protein
MFSATFKRTTGVASQSTLNLANRFLRKKNKGAITDVISWPDKYEIEIDGIFYFDIF